MRRFAVGTALLLLSGCATPLPGSEAIVMTANPEQVRGCKTLGQIDADQLLYGGPQGRDDVRKQLRNKAVQAGATHVLTIGTPNLAGGYSSGSGELYRCG